MKASLSDTFLSIVIHLNDHIGVSYSEKPITVKDKENWCHRNDILLDGSSNWLT